MYGDSPSTFLQLSSGMGARLSLHSLISFTLCMAIKGGLFIWRELRTPLFDADHPQTFIGLVVRPWSTERRGISPQTSRRQWRVCHAAYFHAASQGRTLWTAQKE